MKKTILIPLAFVFIALSSFESDPVSHEQLILDYFISEIVPSDFKTVSTIEFKGRTEDTYSTLGDYKVCLKPEEKLQSILGEITKNSTTNIKELNYSQKDQVSIKSFTTNSTVAKLYIYPELHVADHHYVFVKFSQPGGSDSKYIFQVNVEGKIRSCKMH
jgi:hypothetical protein